MAQEFSIDSAPEFNSGGDILIIACGALAREVLHLIEANNLQHIDLTCIPAKFHNRPEKIAPAVKEKIDKHKGQYKKIYIGYAECGTGGALDKLIKEEGVERLEGAHCYAFYTGQDEFEKLAEEEIGSFYLTDYLARHFDVLIRQGMQLDNPIVKEQMFCHYKRLVYLAQADSADLDAKAEAAAAYLGLSYKRVKTGYGELATFMNRME